LDAFAAGMRFPALARSNRVRSVVRAFFRIRRLGSDGLVCRWRRWLLQLFFSLRAKLDHLDGLSAALRKEMELIFAS